MTSQIWLILDDFLYHLYLFFAMISDHLNRSSYGTRNYIEKESTSISEASLNAAIEMFISFVL